MRGHVVSAKPFCWGLTQFVPEGSNLAKTAKEILKCIHNDFKRQELIINTDTLRLSIIKSLLDSK